jgi:hypothetical protein
MFSVNLQIALVVLLMQKSCCSFGVEWAKHLLAKATQMFSRQEAACQSSGGTAVFINPVEKISC